jgi:hypothetical protein
MAKFSRFEEIQAWQKAREVTLSVYRVSGSGNFARDFGLKDQIRRASVSIMANIAEGHGRRTNPEFANFLNFAHAAPSQKFSLTFTSLMGLVISMRASLMNYMIL